MNKDNKIDYWLMFVEGDITLETLIELINDYVQRERFTREINRFND